MQHAFALRLHGLVTRSPTGHLPCCAPRSRAEHLPSASSAAVPSGLLSLAGLGPAFQLGSLLCLSLPLR